MDDVKDEKNQDNAIHSDESGFFAESPIFNIEKGTNLEKQLYNHYVSKQIHDIESSVSTSKSSQECVQKLSKHFKKDNIDVHEVHELIYNNPDSLSSLSSFNTNHKFTIAQLFGTLMPHSHKLWLKLYSKCKQKNEYGIRQMLWMIIQHQTVHLITNIYKLPSKIRKELHKSVCYSNTNKATDIETLNIKRKQHTTDFGTVNNDCILTALKLRSEGYTPLLLNLANRFAPAAASHCMTECGSQEENLFKRTSVYLSLWQHKSDRIEHNPYAPYESIFENDKGMFKSLFGSKKDKKSDVFYPMHREYGAIYSPNVYVFRGSEFRGYPLLPNDQRCIISMLAVAAESRGGGTFNEDEVSQFENKVRTIYRVAYQHNHNALVLGALGCGIFNNPPQEVAAIFYRILMDEFKGCFEKVYFAIIWDHHSQPELIKSFTKYFPLNEKY